MSQYTVNLHLTTEMHQMSVYHLCYFLQSLLLLLRKNKFSKSPKTSQQSVRKPYCPLLVFNSPCCTVACCTLGQFMYSMVDCMVAITTFSTCSMLYCSLLYSRLVYLLNGGLYGGYNVLQCLQYIVLQLDVLQVSLCTLWWIV